jgi:hypothetical protein
MVDHVQNGAPNAKAGGQRAKRTERAAPDQDVSAQSLLKRLEQQSGQLAILRSKLDETRKALVQEREASRSSREGLEEERRTRERAEANLKRERVVRQQAEGTAEEARALASALEAQHHLLSAKLKVLEHNSGRRRFGRRRVR